MKVFTILATIIGICVAIAASSEVKLPCCPDPPLDPRFGPGPACRKCVKSSKPTLSCCPNPHLDPKFGHGPACRECPTNES